jgi:hypothetical protein
MAVIDGADYLTIAQQYSDAYEGQLRLTENFYNSVQALRCLSDVSVTLALLPDFYTAYQLGTARMNDATVYLAPVGVLQRHVQTNGGLATVSAWIAANVPGHKVPYAFSLLSAQAGYTLLSSVIDYTTEFSSGL